MKVKNAGTKLLLAFPFAEFSGQDGCQKLQLLPDWGEIQERWDMIFIWMTGLLTLD